MSSGNIGRVIYEGHRVRVKITRRKSQKCIFPQCSTLSGHNFNSVKHRAMRFACGMGFSAMADRMVWPPTLSRDQKWPCVTKCMHSQVIGLRIRVNRITYWSQGVASLPHKCQPPLPSDRQHPSYGDCLEVKG